MAKIIGMQTQLAAGLIWPDFFFFNFGLVAKFYYVIHSLALTQCIQRRMKSLSLSKVRFGVVSKEDTSACFHSIKEKLSLSA